MWVKSVVWVMAAAAGRGGAGVKTLQLVVVEGMAGACAASGAAHRVLAEEEPRPALAWLWEVVELQWM